MNLRPNLNRSNLLGYYEGKAQDLDVEFLLVYLFTYFHCPFNSAYFIAHSCLRFPYFYSPNYLVEKIIYSNSSFPFIKEIVQLNGYKMQYMHAEKLIHGKTKYENSFTILIVQPLVELFP